MTPPPIELPAIDGARVTVIMDNSFDNLMADVAIAARVALGPNPFEHPLPIAEHGFSALIEVWQGQKRGTVLFDTGVSRSGILHNMDVLEVRASDIQAIVLSHGHADHAMGLPGLIDRLGIRSLPLLLHPDAYLERKVVLPNGMEVNIPPPKRSDLRRENIEVLESAAPSMLVDNMLLVSGEVARTTEFEKGFATHWAKRDGAWVPDPLIIDDQCAILNLRGKGLVIVTGCGHAGIVNIIRNAQRLTGIEQIYTVIGGFHLSGRLFEPIIAPTVAALQAISPRYLLPAHCTGWSAMHQIARAMPDAFIPNAVGTSLNL